MSQAINPRRNITILLTVLLAVAVAIAIFSQFNAISKTQSDRQLQSYLSNLQSAAYDLMVEGQKAALGDREAYDRLPELDKILEDAGGRFAAGASELPNAEVAAFSEEVKSLRAQINSMLLKRESVFFLYDQAALLETNIPQIQQSYNVVTDVMLRTGTPADQVAESQAQVWRAETMLGGLRKILAGSGDALGDAESFRQNVLLFSQVLTGMLEGNRLLGIGQVTSADAKKSLQQIQQQFSETNQSVQLVLDSTPALTEVRQANAAILASVPNFLTRLGELADSINGLASGRSFSSQTALYSVAAAVAILFLLGVMVYMGTRSNLEVTEETNERNQQAILRLLDEIADLGEGDLRVKATVTEDFTGAIADSINFAIEQLRELVANVVQTAESVVASSNQTRATSLQLSEAAEHQAEQVAIATSSIKAIAESIRRVSASAVESAAEAKRSVEIASNGSAVVRNTITGMDSIREQIQDTSKRIKRLGESSQEVGDIVSLIDEIADQTNILALNASIQAAMAGEAGRGFAVVADEVQRLSERVAAATKQIETLVKTIQSDTNEAVSSMEQTTTEVVRGAQLANDAGKALDEIETVSKNLAELILSISTAAQQQSLDADSVAGSMTVIQDISSQTLLGTTETARSVGELAEQAIQLRDSVADFKLPGESTVVTTTDSEMEEETHAMDELLGLDRLDPASLSGLSEEEQLREDLAALNAQSTEQELEEVDLTSNPEVAVDADDLENFVAHDSAAEIEIELEPESDTLIAEEDSSKTEPSKSA